MGSQKVAAEGDLVIRRMADATDDYELMVRWRNLPHVRYWWDPDLPPLTVESARNEYQPDTQPTSESTACIAELNGKPVGFIQFYRWLSYAEEADEVGIPYDDRTWGIDIFIGEAGELQRGLGTRMMDLLCEHLETHLGATSIVLTTELENHTAIRCYEKAGFVRSGQVVDTDTRDGVRTRDWLMIRRVERPGVVERE
jgi:RimJ/RimL family protein N-acetyltransferase